MGMEGRRRLVQVFPDTTREWWDKWEIRGLLLISIVSQIVLILLGNRRKYGTNKVIDSILWGAYLLADKVPSIALGAISSKFGDYYDEHGEQMEDPQLVAFWAPFFLMHIGGPDTITAYSLEDNEMWLRHLVGWVFQTLITLYIILLSWDSSSWLSYLSIPMLFVGCVNCGERTWSLYSAANNFSGYFKLTSDLSLFEEPDNKRKYVAPWRSSIKATMYSQLSDMVLGTADIEGLKQIILLMDDGEAFDFASSMHGIMYDFFYTKATVMASIWGGISWLTTLLALAVVLTLHMTFNTESNKYSRADHIITLILLFGSIISRFVSTILLIVSYDWAWFTMEDMKINNWALSRIKIWFKNQIHKKQTKWNVIAQFNFFNLLCSEKDRFIIFGDSLPIRNVEKIHVRSHCQVSLNLKKMLLSNIQKKLLESTSTQSQHGLRYKELIKTQSLCKPRLIIENLEFHQSILLWHIVTNVCYYYRDRSLEDDDHLKESKTLSDYMFYLLVKQRHMLPTGAILPSLRDTLAEAIRFCEMNSLDLPSDVSEGCKTILRHITKDPGDVGSHHKSRSVFSYAFLIADHFLTHGIEKQMWGFLIELWFEFLTYSAAQCRTNRHVQQLAYGGEFISHIWKLQFLEQYLVTEPSLEDNGNV